MNIYISHCGGVYDYENELYEPLKESSLAREHHFFLPHEPQNLDTDAATELKHTDMPDLLSKLRTFLGTNRQ